MKKTFFTLAALAVASIGVFASELDTNKLPFIKVGETKSSSLSTVKSGTSEYTAVQPATGSRMESLSTIQMTFESVVTVKSKFPSIVVRKDDASTGSTVSVDSWMMVDNSSDHKTLTIFPCDYDYYVSPILFDADTEYYITIPAGVLSYASGNTNEEMVLLYKGISETPILEYTTIAPAMESEMASFPGVNMTFESTVTVQTKFPDIVVRKGDATTGTTVSVDDWMVVDNSSDHKTLFIFPCDYDYYTCPVVFEKGADYYITIPAGTMADASGTENEEIVLHYKGEAESEPLVYTTIEPAMESEMASFTGVNMTFASTVTVQTKFPDIVVRKGDATTGSTVSVDDWMVVDNSSDHKTLFIFPCDYDYYTTPVAFEKGEDYYITIPAGTMVDADGTENEAFVLHYKGEALITTLTTTAVVPASGSYLESLNTLNITFDQAVEVASKMPSIVVRKEDATTGSTVSVDGWFAVDNSSDHKTVTVFPCDYDYYTTPIALEEATDYYVTIPAGAFVTASGIESDEMVLTYTGASQSAAVGTEFEVDLLTYKVIREGVVEVSDADGDALSFEIPAVVSYLGCNYDVKAIGYSAFKYCDVTTVVLPNSIDSIHESAFSSSDLVTINLPESLVYIGYYTFSCDYLTAITIPSGITAIPENCFFSADALASVTMSEGIKSIGKAAFYNCKKLKSIVIPESCDSLAPKVFLSCSALEEIVLPEGLRVMGEAQFNGCKKLQSITIPSNITYLGDEMFLSCESLTSVNISANIDSLGYGVFAKTGITEFTIDPANTAYTLVDGTIYSADKRLLYAYPPKGATTCTVDTACVGIMAGAFWGSDVESVVLPEGMLAIDFYAFCESQLSEINFPKSLIYMGDQALAGTQFTSITLPENMPYISDGLLAWSYSLESVTIPAGVVNIANHAFQTCKALTQVHLLGTIPPTIDDYYSESDNPFGYVTRDDVTLSIPAGYTETYDATTWGDLFSTIIDSEVAPLAYTAIDPTVDAGLASITSINITYDTSVVIEESDATIEVVKDDILLGETVAVEGWDIAVNDNKTVTLTPCDAAGNATTIELDNIVDYYIIIPAGIISNGNGCVNEITRIHYVGDKLASIEETTTASYQISQNGMQLTVSLESVGDIAVYNTLGSLVSTQTATSQLQFDAPMAGVYIVRVTTATGITTFKALIK